MCDPCGNCVCCRHAADTGAADGAVTVECAVVAGTGAVECSDAVVDTGVAEAVSDDVGTDNAQVTSAPQVMITEEESGAVVDTGVAEGVSVGDADTGTDNAEGDSDADTGTDTAEIDGTVVDTHDVCPICNVEVGWENVGGEIVCDGCDQWFHLRCMGKSKRWARSIKKFYCNTCSNVNDE